MSCGPLAARTGSVAGIIILATGFRWADAIASLIVVALMLRAAWGLLRDSGRILPAGPGADPRRPRYGLMTVMSWGGLHPKLALPRLLRGHGQAAVIEKKALQRPFGPRPAVAVVAGPGQPDLDLVRPRLPALCR